MKKAIRHILIAHRELKRNFRVAKAKEFQTSRLEADIIRNVHSIEKGLSIENPRKGFGALKIKALFSLISKYLELENENIDCVYFAKDALAAYLSYHDVQNYCDDNIKEIQLKYEELIKMLPQQDEVFGGVEIISKSDFDFSISEVEKLFSTRHSVREFSGEGVEDELIKKAIKLAQRCPSACNRQGVRVYSLTSKKLVEVFSTALDGIGGFVENADKFLLITGKLSAYSIDEKNQYIVSASIFAGYLSLTLHAYGIANCLIQRPLTPVKIWDEACEKLSIPKDEHLCMFIALGKYKETTKVPVSKRFDVEKIYKAIN